MRATGFKVLGVAVGLAAAGVLIGLYVSKLTTDNGSAAYTVPVQTQGGHKVVDLQIETVAAVGPQFSPAHPDYVSYLVRDTQGKWLRRTVWRLPANATVHVTIYNFDSASGLRNPLLRAAAGGRRQLVHARRQADRRHRPERHLAHLCGAGVRAGHSAARHP